MSQVPNRIDADSLPWFYQQHRLLWDWIASLSVNDIIKIVAARPGYSPDYAIKAAWPGWETRWGAAYGSYACEVAGSTAQRCFNCPLGSDYCQRAGSGYQKFLDSIRAGDIAAFRAAALEVRDAWAKPETSYNLRGWW